MRWQDQTTFFDPEIKGGGNCAETCIASLLDIPLESVPKFYDHTDPDASYRYWRNMENFMFSQGYWLHRIDGEYRHEGLYMVSGPSARDCLHMVVYRNGELFHDPHPSRKGVKKVTQTWLFLPLDPAHKDSAMEINIRLRAEAANKLTHIPYTGSNGLYSAVVPLPDSAEKILAIADELELSPDADALHTTVIYSKKTPGASIAAVKGMANPSFEYRGVINAVSHWEGHNGKTYIVLSLVSEGIVMANADFQRAGAEHTFTPFTPHVTLSDEVPLDDAMKARIEFVNKRLAFKPLEVRFTGQIVGDLDDD